MKTDNELIAEFMGWKKNDWGYWVSSFNGAHFDKGELHYDKVWDWLMPVVEKISQMHDSKFKYDFTQIKQGNWPADNEYMEVITLPLATPILDVHKAVLQFIKWYNLNTTQP